MKPKKNMYKIDHISENTITQLLICLHICAMQIPRNLHGAKHRKSCTKKQRECSKMHLWQRVLWTHKNNQYPIPGKRLNLSRSDRPYCHWSQSWQWQRTLLPHVRVTVRTVKLLVTTVTLCLLKTPTRSTLSRCTLSRNVLVQVVVADPRCLPSL